MGIAQVVNFIIAVLHVLTSGPWAERWSHGDSGGTADRRWWFVNYQPRNIHVRVTTKLEVNGRAIR